MSEANELKKNQKHCFHNETIKFIFSSHRAIFVLLYIFNAQSGKWRIWKLCHWLFSGKTNKCRYICKKYIVKNVRHTIW